MSEASSPQKNINITDSAENSPTKQPPSPIQKSKTGGIDLNTKSAFVTGTNFSGKKGFEEKGKIDEVYNYHDKLNGLIEQLDSKVRTLLNENQTNFLMAYKEQMLHIQKELKALKKKIDEETYKRKNDERMNILEQERDWFRAEAIRLDKVCKEQQRVMQELKFKLKMVNEDKNYFEEFVLTAKKENKALKEELMQFELGRKSTDDQNLPTSGRKAQLTNSAKKDRSPSPRKSYDLKGDSPQTDDNMRNFASNQLPNFTNEEKLLEIIKQMKVELDKERKQNRQLRNEKSQIIVQRIELEQILVESINEVKKEIARRRNTKALKDINRGPPVPQDIDITKFSATDKKHLLEYFMSNEAVLEELYNLVFTNPNPNPNPNPIPNLPTPSDRDGQMLTNTNSNGSYHQTHKSEGKLKYSFNYGFGGANNIRTLPKDLNNVMGTQKAQTLIGELRRPEAKKAEFFRKDL